MGGNFPHLLPLATSLIWWGPWWVVSSAPSKLWACVRAHSFQRQRTHINLLRTNILLNIHIVAQGCRQEIFQGGPNKNKSSINHKKWKNFWNSGGLREVCENSGGLWPSFAPPCWCPCCCTWVVAQVLQILVISRKVCTHTKTSALTDYKKLEGTLGVPTN